MKMKRGIQMVQLNVDLPADLKREFKAAAALDGVPLKEWIITALKARKTAGLSSPAKGAGCPDTVDSVTAAALRLAGERPKPEKGRR